MRAPAATNETHEQLVDAVGRERRREGPELSGCRLRVDAVDAGLVRLPPSPERERRGRMQKRPYREIVGGLAQGANQQLVTITEPLQQAVVGGPAAEHLGLA